MSKYLFISAHADDCELSCGGTMAKLVEQGHNVFHVALSNCGNQELNVEFKNASTALGVESFMEQYKAHEFIQSSQRIADYFHGGRNEFDFVFTHSEVCRHIDHKVVGEEAKRVFNCNLATFIQPWNGGDSSNYFVELSEAQLQKKIDALKCYKSQSHRPYMSEDFIRSWAVYTGIRCGKKYAEGFKIERLINIGT